MSVFVILGPLVLFVVVFFGIVAGVHIYGRIVLFLEKMRICGAASGRELRHVW